MSSLSFADKQSLTHIYREPTMNQFYQHSEESKSIRKETIAEEDNIQEKQFVSSYENNNLEEQLRVEFNNFDSNNRNCLSYQELLDLLENHQFTDINRIREHLIVITKESYVEGQDISWLQFVKLYAFLQDDSKVQELPVNAVICFYGNNSLVSNLNQKLQQFNLNPPKRDEQDFLTSQQDLFQYRLKLGMGFNCLNNAQKSVILNEYGYYYSSQLPTSIYLDNIYLGYELWDYFQSVQHQMRQTIQKSPAISAVTLRDRAAVTTPSNRDTQFLKQNYCFVYQNNFISFNLIEGVRSSIKSEPELRIYIYIYIQLHFTNNQKNLNVCNSSGCTGTLYSIIWIARTPFLHVGGSLLASNRKTSPQLTDFYTRLEREKLFYRGAAIALCHFDFAKSLEFLQKSLNIEDDSTLPAPMLVKFSQFRNEVKLLQQLVQGLKNIDTLLNEDRELRQCLFFQVVEYPDAKLVKSDSLFSGEQSQISQQDFEFYSNSKLYDLNFEVADMLNINSKGLRLQMVKKSLEFIQQLVRGMQMKNPYLQLIGRFIETSNFQSYIKNELMEQPINCLDKVALLLRFTTAKDYQVVLNRKVQEATEIGDISFIPFVGKSIEVAIQILQSYVNNTADIQLAGFIAAHLYYLEFPQQDTLAKFFYEYKQYLNQTKQYERRTHLEYEILEYEKIIFKNKTDIIPINQMIQREEKNAELIQNPNRIIACCMFCKKNIGQPYLEQERKNILRKTANMGLGARDDRPRTSSCPLCYHHFAKCCICVMPLSLPNIFLDKDDRKRQQGSMKKHEETQSLDTAYVWCQTCRHGGHFQHVMDWFMIYSVCPVADCNCECSVL